MTADTHLPVTVTELSTRSGASLSIRPANPDDEALLEGFFEHVTPEDRRFRFLSTHAHIGPEQIEPMTHGDHFHSDSWLAFDEATGELIGSAMLAADGPFDTGEVAVSIRADWRDKGVGWALLRYVSEQAEKRGIRRVISIEDRENHAAIELEREQGFTATGVEGDPSLVLVEKILR